MKKILTVLFVLLPILCIAQGNGYSFARLITVTSQASGTNSNYPAMFCLNTTLGNGNNCLTGTWSKTVGNGGKFQNSSGFDHIYSTTQDCLSTVNYEQDDASYNPVTGALIDHIKFLTITSGSTLYICYGNSLISTFQGGSVGSTWDSSFAAVYHLPNTGTTCRSNAYPDSTVNSNTLALGPGSGASCNSGQMYGDIESTNTTFGNPSTANSSTSLNITSKISLSAWVYILTYPTTLWSIIISKNINNSPFSYDYGFGINGPGLGVGTTGQLYFLAGNQPTTVWHSTALIPLNTWTFVSVTVDETLGSNRLSFWINGILDSQPSYNSTMVVNSDQLQLLADNGVNNLKWLAGAIDEPRIENVTRSSDWILTTYNNQNHPDTFYTIGSELGGSVVTQIGTFIVGP